MSDRVAIVGIGLTPFRAADDDRLYHEHDYEAAKLALADAGLDRGDIDTVICSGWDAVDGRTISDMHTAMSAGGYLKDSSHVGEDGIMALAYAYMRIAAGLFDVALVSAHGHAESSFETVSTVVFDPLFVRPLGQSHLVSLALQASAYAQRYGVSDEQAAAVVVRTRANGAGNPRNHLQSPVSLEEVIASVPVCYPLRALHCPPQSVGGAALILASEDAARRISERPSWITGIAWAIDSYELGSKDLTSLGSAAAAARKAYAMAGINDPVQALDLAELHDITPFHELMAREALGLAPEGQGGRPAEAADAGPPVNPSGGVLSTNPYGAAGLLRAAEAALQLRGEAGRQQVPAAGRALAHGMSAPSGAAARTDCVVILEGG
ncbi:MAG TPA: thiolase family protein [Dehalococcoidia bacterium]|nr:thiolase family protein [Dehalococcoidia bacterium]